MDSINWLAILSPIIGAVVTALAAFLTQFIRARTRNEVTQGALIRLVDGVSTAVRDVQQNIVEDLKAKTRDGRLTAVQVDRVKQKAQNRVRAMLGEKGVSGVKRDLELTDKDLSDLISGKIEAAVWELRKDGPAKKKPAPEKRAPAEIETEATS